MPPEIAANISQSRVALIPGLPWLRIGLLALALVGGSIGLLESHWRGCGFPPTVIDTKELWHFWRQRVYRDDGKVIVFLGTSRILADISLAAVENILPGYSAIQLGISGTASPLGILTDLATDPDFKGLIVCELYTPMLLQPLHAGHEDFIAYRPSSVPEYRETVFKAWLDGHLAVCNNRLAIRSLLRPYFGTHEAATLQPTSETFSRQVNWDFAGAPKGTPTFGGQDKGDACPPFDDLRPNALALRAIVEQLKARGGEVVFLRLPSTGDRWLREQQIDSKGEHWDRLPAITGAICIHFTDVPDMRDLNCPDNSHLSDHDAPVFTRSLIREVMRRDRRLSAREANLSL